MEKSNTIFQSNDTICLYVLRACFGKKILIQARHIFKYWCVKSKQLVFTTDTQSKKVDVENKEVGYLLGRLFAVLERIQIQSAGGESKLNKTIRDRFWGVYSTSPRTVMPMLLRLKNYHIGKLEGSKNYFESLIASIMEGFEPRKIPAHLTLEQQSYLAVGYYHQRQDFYKKREIKEED